MLGPALPSLPRYLTEVVTQIIKHVKVHVVTQIIITLTRSPHNTPPTPSFQPPSQTFNGQSCHWCSAL